jgi:hypothetical protein
MEYQREKGDASDFSDKQKIETIIRNDVILRNLYKRSIPEVITYADGLTQAEIKPVLRSLLILAWILVRRLTK